MDLVAYINNPELNTLDLKGILFIADRSADIRTMTVDEMHEANYLVQLYLKDEDPDLDPDEYVHGDDFAVGINSFMSVDYVIRPPLILATEDYSRLN